MDLKVKIIKEFKAAPSHMMDTALSWYERAFNECVLLSEVFEVPLSKVVGVVAALSPNNKWKRNLADAWTFLDNPSIETKVCTFKAQRQKALDILNCDGKDESIMGILKGSKTRNFYHNILYWEFSNRVTVDRWAYKSVDLKPSAKNYKIAEKAYQEAAEFLNLRPHQVQAVLWGVERGKIA